MVVKVSIIKCGNIATSTVAELLLDERANRKIEIRVLGTGAKMGEEETQFLCERVKDFNSDLIVYMSPNLEAPGPRKAVDLLSKFEKPVILISDGPKKAKKIVPENLGFVILPCDPMMGVRREFLDPTEMAYFNADALKVLAATGAVRLLQKLLDEVIQSIEEGRNVELPRIVLKRDKTIKEAQYDNPYAKTKAMACFEMAEKVGEMTVEGCFLVPKDKDIYIPIVSSAHELLRQAAILADEAREIEKSNDMVIRFPHRKIGVSLSKRRLMEKPPK
ncbi:MAG: F420-dependent methylenetetrahydromethanopterin dehydrogenase [Candidatus Methanofastidiosia archaeon]